MEENNNVEVLNEQPTQPPVQQPVQQPTYTAPAAPVKPSVPEEYEPVSVGAYIGYTLLFGIPCIGFIIALVIAFGGNKKISLKNYAKAYLLILLIAIVLTVIITLIGGAALFNIFNSVVESSNYGLGA